jgi:hypothetical protein
MCPPAAPHRLALALLLLITPITLKAQRTRIAIPIDSTRTIRLNGNLRPAALRRNDLGRMNRAETLPAMTLYLKPSPNQQTELREVLEDQQRGTKLRSSVRTTGPANGSDGIREHATCIPSGRVVDAHASQ